MHATVTTALIPVLFAAVALVPACALDVDRDQMRPRDTAGDDAAVPDADDGSEPDAVAEADDADTADETETVDDAATDEAEIDEADDGEAYGDDGGDEIDAAEDVVDDSVGDTDDVADESDADAAEAGDDGGPRCGNGSIDTGEDCDDMNEVPGDGCEGTCLFTCQGDPSCDDGNECTQDACVPGGEGRLCGHDVLDGAPCDDGVFCNGPDACDPSGNCTPDSADACATAPCVRCDEPTDQCVVDAGKCFIDGSCWTEGDVSPGYPCLWCRPGGTSPTAWANRADGTDCDDGLWCNGSDYCSAGTCTPGTPPCDPACTACDEGANRCDIVGPYCYINGTCYGNGAQTMIDVECVYCAAPAFDWWCCC